MGAEATIVSLKEFIIWKEPLLPPVVEQRLHNFFQRLGAALGYKGIIPGHIKLVAAIDAAPERFLFLSMTQADCVDRKPSTAWSSADTEALSSARLDINVLVFGHEKSAVAKTVEQELRREVW